MNAADIFVALVKERDRAVQCAPDSWKHPLGTVNIEFVPRTSDSERGRYRLDDETVEIHRYGCIYGDTSLSPAELAAASSCPLDELIYFAHELGHHEANLSGLACVFDEGRPAETYESEVWAWELGRAILATTMFLDWADFDNRLKVDLDGYRTNLSLTVEAVEEIDARIRQDAPNIIEGRRRTSRLSCRSAADGRSQLNGKP